MRVRFLSRVKFLGCVTAMSLFLCLTLLALNNISLWKGRDLDKMSCDAIINIYKENRLLSIRLKYSFLGGEGIATLSGILKIDDELFNVSRHVFFKYKRVDNSFYFEDTHVNISLQDNAGSDGLLDMLPDFYTKKGARANFQVYKQTPGGYVFVKEFTPAFYCTEQRY
ncbi:MULTISPECIES: hypothetical protein [Enterobacter]|uniref:FidL-like membrane protein n=2 Tax=Enterobacteriaceae TaxID=543 RepID=A0ABY8DY92_9ENTR|nr:MULTISPECIES: hypothetical protein [Enterobacter]WFC81902.1 hypothetical protein OM418_18085 [Enterobacter quasiroggenkampii]WFC86147.1 hypothetical protein OM419_17470 [Enterobacter roggenkampii]